MMKKIMIALVLACCACGTVEAVPGGSCIRLSAAAARAAARQGKDHSDAWTYVEIAGALAALVVLHGLGRGKKGGDSRKSDAE